jgi:hypothetical protein
MGRQPAETVAQFQTRARYAPILMNFAVAAKRHSRRAGALQQARKGRFAALETVALLNRRATGNNGTPQPQKSSTQARGKPRRQKADPWP